MTYTCLVCSYPKLKSPPHSPSGGGSYEICPSCGYQYGVSDDDLGITPAQWRSTWVARGAPWSSAGIKAPKDWKSASAAVTVASKTKAKTAKTAAATKPTKAAKVDKPAAKATPAKKPVKKAPVRKKSS